MATGSQVELGNISTGFDNISSYIDSKFGVARTLDTSLDTQLSTFEATLSTQSTAAQAAGTAADEGITSVMEDMQKEQMSACAALGLNVNGMFGSLIKGIGDLADGLIFKPINSAITAIKNWFSGLDSGGLPDLSSIISNLNKFAGWIVDTISAAATAVGDVLEGIYRISGLKDLATGILGGINAIIGCGEDFIEGLGGLSPDVMSRNPIMNTSSQAATFAKSVSTATDSIGDIISEAKNKAVAMLDLDTQVEDAILAGDAVSDSIIANSQQVFA